MQTIQDIIDQSLTHKRSGKFNPSSFGMCYRRQIWNRMDESKSNPPDARSLRVFKAGDLFEDFVRELVVKSGTGWKYIGDEPIECDDIKGYGDLECNNEVADIKSQHSRSFWQMVKCEDIEVDKYHNWLQVLYYARERKKQFGRLVFVSKDDLCIQEYVQPLDGYWLGQLDAELKALRYLWKKQEIPPAQPRCVPTAKGTYWHCDYCSWKDKCNLLEKENKND